MSRRRTSLRAGWASLTTAAALAISGCAGGPPPEGPPPEKPINLSCVETNARRDPFVAAVKTTTPSRGPAAGAKRYVNIRFKNGASMTVTQWPDPGAASAAASRYQTNAQVSIGALGTTLEVLSDRPPAGVIELDGFKTCGVGRP